MEVRKERSENDQPLISKSEPKVSREQRRFQERIQNEARDMNRKLVDIFYETFIKHDPASEEVKLKQAEVSAKWKMYCRNRGLTKAAFEIVDKSCESIIKQFEDEKAGILPEPEEDGDQV